MEICIVNNNGKFEAVNCNPNSRPLNCVLVIPDGKTWKNEYLLVKTNVIISWQDYYNYAGYRVLKAHYKGRQLFYAHNISNPQVVIDALERFNSISNEELEGLYNDALDKQKTALELKIEELTKEKATLEEQMKIYKEIQTKKEEIKALLEKLTE